MRSRSGKSGAASSGLPQKSSPSTRAEAAKKDTTASARPATSASQQPQLNEPDASAGPASKKQRREHSHSRQQANSVISQEVEETNIKASWQERADLRGKPEASFSGRGSPKHSSEGRANALPSSKEQKAPELKGQSLHQQNDKASRGRMEPAHPVEELRPVAHLAASEPSEKLLVSKSEHQPISGQNSIVSPSAGKSKFTRR